MAAVGIVALVLVAALVALGAILLYVTGAGAKALAWLGDKFKVLKEDALASFGGIADALRIIEAETDVFRLALNLETLYVVDPVTEEFEPLSDILRFPHLPAATQVIGDATEGNEAAEPTEFAIGTDDKGLDLWQQTRMGYFHDGDHKLYMYVHKALFDERGCLHSITGETRVEIDAPVECEDGGGGTGDIFKSVYDTDNNGIVDGAEALDDGVTYVSAGEVRTHIGDEAKHREIDDEGAGLTDLWSASKITDELAGKADTDHAHVAADVTDLDTEVGNHPDVAANTAARHARQHGLNASADHSGIPGTPNNLMALDAGGLPKDKGQWIEGSRFRGRRTGDGLRQRGREQHRGRGEQRDAARSEAWAEQPGRPERDRRNTRQPHGDRCERAAQGQREEGNRLCRGRARACGRRRGRFRRGSREPPGRGSQHGRAAQGQGERQRCDSRLPVGQGRGRGGFRDRGQQQGSTGRRRNPVLPVLLRDPGRYGRKDIVSVALPGEG